MTARKKASELGQNTLTMDKKKKYEDASTCISLDGQYFDWFAIQGGGGYDWGYPSSPYLFLIVAKILSSVLRQNTKMKDIHYH